MSLKNVLQASLTTQKHIRLSHSQPCMSPTGLQGTQAFRVYGTKKLQAKAKRQAAQANVIKEIQISVHATKYDADRKIDKVHDFLEKEKIHVQLTIKHTKVRSVNNVGKILDGHLQQLAPFCNVVSVDKSSPNRAIALLHRTMLLTRRLDLLKID